jgi:PPM family protein phosphatase
MYEVTSASRSDTGYIREINEDAVLETGNLFAVADGMGGHRAGEVASTVALEFIEDYMGENLGLISGEKLVDKAISGANSAVHHKAVSSSRYRDMGTTATLLYREGDTAYIGHVGDSRAYLFRNGTLKQLTSDHSLVAKLVEEGQITEEESRSHPQRNIILKALGLQPRVEIDVISVKIQPGDTFLLATDGLTGVVPDQEIAAILASEPEVTGLVERLVAAALEAGGPDNVSVVAISFAESPTVVPVAGSPLESAPAGEGVSTAASGGGRLKWIILVVVLVAVLGAGFGVGYYFFNNTYFIGSKGERVTLYRGFPFWGMSVVEEQTDIEVRFLPESLRTKVEDNLEPESRRNALETIDSLALEVERNSSIVPDVEGRRYDEARAVIEDAGLRYEVELVSREKIESDVVITQEPEPGRRVGKGSVVRLKVVMGGTPPREV